MKTYLRLLSFAKPIEKFAIPYIFFTLLAILFNTLNFALLAPLLDTLFSGNTYKPTAIVAEKPSMWDIMAIFKFYVNKGIANYGPWETLKTVCGVIIISVLLANLFKYFSQRVMENLRVHTLLNLRKSVFNNVMNLHLGYFSNERKGDIISKIASDVQVVQYTVTSTLQVAFKEPVQLIAYIIMLFAISAKLTFFALLIVPILALIIGRIVKQLKRQATESQESFGLMISFLDEALSGIKIVKAFNAEEAIKNKFNRENKRYTDIQKRMARRQQLASPVSEFLSVSMVTGVVLYGGYLVMNKTSLLDAPAFIAYVALCSQVMRPAKALTDSFSNIHSGLAAGERVLELIDTRPAIFDDKKPIELLSIEKGIRFENVSFSYGDNAVLKDVNLTISKGKSIALVGPSGGGKSTLMDLIPRFSDASTGQIYIDDVEIKKVKISSLRDKIGFVNQESILFNDTIFNNIAFSKPGSTIEEVEAAARIANAHDFIINTEKGYQTNIGDRGMKLSGGQKQRINIARAVLKNPPIMLLDEATSALDTESEKLVQDALNKLMNNRTTLIIAHRLSTIQNADKIIVLDGGKIIEQGSHSQLINRNGLYKKLIDMQTFND